MSTELKRGLRSRKLVALSALTLATMGCAGGGVSLTGEGMMTILEVAATIGFVGFVGICFVGIMSTPEDVGDTTGEPKPTLIPRQILNQRARDSLLR